MKMVIMMVITRLSQLMTRLVSPMRDYSSWLLFSVCSRFFIVSLWDVSALSLLVSCDIVCVELFSAWTEIEIEFF